MNENVRKIITGLASGRRPNHRPMSDQEFERRYDPVGAEHRELMALIGDRVRFRIGERIPFVAKCCGKEIDSWQTLVDAGLLEGVFVISNWHVNLDDPTCDLPSEHLCANLLPLILKLDHFKFGGSDWWGFGAYPEELTLVEEADG